MGEEMKEKNKERSLDDKLYYLTSPENILSNVRLDGQLLRAEERGGKWYIYRDIGDRIADLCIDEMYEYFDESYAKAKKANPSKKEKGESIREYFHWRYFYKYLLNELRAGIPVKKLGRYFTDGVAVQIEGNDTGVKKQRNTRSKAEEETLTNKICDEINKLIDKDISPYKAAEILSKDSMTLLGDEIKRGAIYQRYYRKNRK
jgi:hypothetical protein